MLIHIIGGEVYYTLGSIATEDEECEGEETLETFDSFYNDLKKLAKNKYIASWRTSKAV